MPRVAATGWSARVLPAGSFAPPAPASTTLEIEIVPVGGKGAGEPAPGANSDRVLEFADRALYRAKRGGRARTVDYDPLVDHEPPSPDRN